MPNKAFIAQMTILVRVIWVLKTFGNKKLLLGSNFYLWAHERRKNYQ